MKQNLFYIRHNQMRRMEFLLKPNNRNIQA